MGEGTDTPTLLKKGDQRLLVLDDSRQSAGCKNIKWMQKIRCSRFTDTSHTFLSAEPLR